MGGKPNEQRLSAKDLNEYAGKRARKGKQIARNFTPWESTVRKLMPGLGLGVVADCVAQAASRLALASAAVFMGRNQGLYDFWFYVTSFARYPGDMYRQGAVGEIFWFGFSFVIPILLVVTVPSRLFLQKSLSPNWGVVLIAPALTALTLWGSRRVFLWSLSHYRSASS